MEPIRALPFGTTRSRVTINYSLITPDTHIVSPLVNWHNATAIVHIAPEMGARFLQYTAILESEAKSGSPGEGVERFIFVLDGSVKLLVGGKASVLKQGAFAFIPAGMVHEISTEKSASTPAARLTVFEKKYQSSTAATPALCIGNEGEIPGDVYQGDPALRLKTFLPVEPAFDLAVNLFTYESGGHLPQVEIHLMEHGLLMLQGTGIYRLGDEWFPVQAGDVIWMASYCPQWFVAMGKTPARYLYYKDIHRDRLSERS
jgi:(S)-ureidoglycine aminohydrolase